MKAIVIIVTSIFIIAVAFLFIARESSDAPELVALNTTINMVTTAPPDPALEAGSVLSNGTCTGEEKPLLTHAPMRDEDFPMIIPYGLMIGGHVTPIDHQYFEPADYNSSPDSYPVYAMADATLVDIGTRQSQFGSDEYRLVFTISCKLFYYYDLLTSLSPDILQEFETSGQRVEIAVTAGQEIGRIGGQTLDFAVWDTDVRLEGFVVPDHYSGEAWKIHTVDPLNYYTDELKERLLKKYIRTAEPRSGKIDHDIDGTLQGNWFRADAVGYTAYQGPGNYWLTHASFSPHHIDPSGFVISLGDFDGEAQQFGAKGNAPLPQDVTTDSDVVKYTLTQIILNNTNGEPWDRSSLTASAPVFQAGGEESGCLLVQLEETRKLKLEVFPGQSCDVTNNFTANVKRYER